MGKLFLSLEAAGDLPYTMQLGPCIEQDAPLLPPTILTLLFKYGRQYIKLSQQGGGEDCLRLVSQKDYRVLGEKKKKDRTRYAKKFLSSAPIYMLERFCLYINYNLIYLSMSSLPSHL